MTKKLVVNFANRKAVKVDKWKVDVGQTVYHGRILLLYEDSENKLAKLKSKCVGTVIRLIAKEGEILNPGDEVLEIEEGCNHPTIMNDLCAECGADLQKEGVESSATVPMVHHIPQLKVSQREAEMIGREDTERLLKDRKLVLLVDLDQTLIHTTHDNIPNNIKDVHHFQLGTHAWYHTRLRPNTSHFLSEMSKYFELHICTFGVRPYAHMVANILDRDHSLFSNRILSRDECFNFNSKVANLSALFPNGDELVCIIDDRKDVWNNSPNLIPVKPYVFFTNTGDINDPYLPPITKHSDFFAKGVTLKKKEVEDNRMEIEEDFKEIEVKLDSKEYNNKQHDNVDSLANSTIPSGKTLENESLVNHEEQETLDSAELKNRVGSLVNKDEELKNRVGSLVNNDEEIKNRVGSLVNKDDEMKNRVGRVVKDGVNKEELKDDMLDVEDEDDYLLYLESILKKVHSLFYKVYDKEMEGTAHVRWVLEQLKGHVLKDCEIVFSGLIPLHEGLEQSEPYLMATDLGAKIGKTVCETTTHIVAAKDGTAKIHESKKYPKIKVVNPQWLTDCLYRWERVDERLYPLVKSDKPSSQQTPIQLKFDDMVSMQQEVLAEFTDSSDSDDSKSVDSQAEVDGEADWSLLGEEIEKGLEDF